jgi:glycosyltransferase involved in cell wall biosynthesis
MKQATISVITVVYNGAATLEATLQSIAAQTWQHVEYIIVDGGSTDGTLALIEKYKDHIASWVSEPDKGVYDAMNKGIRMATGDFLYFLGSDDCFHDADVLQAMFGNEPVEAVDILYGDVVSPSYKSRYDGPFDYAKLLRRNVSHQAAFYRRTLFDRFGNYDLRYRMHADWEFNLRCFRDNTVRTKYKPVLVASFGAEGISAGHDLPFLRERLIPAKLDWLAGTGMGALRDLRFYDEWWRALRNAGFRDAALLKQSLPGRSLPRPIENMLRSQRRVPAAWLKKGALSKLWMLVSYVSQIGYLRSL